MTAHATTSDAAVPTVGERIHHQIVTAPASRRAFLRQASWATVAAGATGQGRLGTVAAAVLLPCVATSALRLTAPDDDRRWRAVWRTTLGLGLLVAFVPPGGVQTVALGGAECFRVGCGSATFSGYGVPPTYEIPSSGTYGAGLPISVPGVPDMVAPFAGAIGATRGLADEGEPELVELLADVSRDMLSGRAGRI